MPDSFEPSLDTSPAPVPPTTAADRVTPPRPERRALPPLPPRQPPPAIPPALLEPESLKVIARLRRHGFDAYLVGGCVRDLLAGAEPKDFDVVTDAHPEQIRGVFRNSRLVGRRFRLAHVFFPNGQNVEVATFRSNPNAALEVTEAPANGVVAEPANGGGGEDLLVTDDNQFGTAEEDAKRRDFTINGLFYDVQDGRIIDYVSGMSDLSAKLVRTIGDPEIRLREDPVRGLRAARIAAKLGFEVERGTFEAMARHAGELPRCAPARVLEETLKLLRAGASRPAFRILREADILRVLLPPVEEALVRGGNAAQAEFGERLGVLDRMIIEGAPITDAVMLATLLSFLPDPSQARAESAEGEDDELDEESVDDAHATILPSADRVLSQMSQHARLPRRVADRVRAVVASQKFFTAAQKKRRRRGKSGGFVRTPHFPESLQLFEISVRATGKGAESLAKWKQKHAESIAGELELASNPVMIPAPAVVAEAPAPVVDDPARSIPPPPPPPLADGAMAAAPTADAAKKKRRRGGRRHRKNKEETAAGVNGADATTPAPDDAGDTDPPDAEPDTEPPLDGPAPGDLA